MKEVDKMPEEEAVELQDPCRYCGKNEELPELGMCEQCNASEELDAQGYENILEEMKREAAEAEKK